MTTPEKRTGPPGEWETDSESIAAGDSFPSTIAEVRGLPSSSSVVDQSPLAQMRRRREAALRLPPLESGMRDPHFDPYPKDGASE